MINIRCNILTLLSLLLLGLGTSSCASEEIKEPINPDDGMPTLAISIGLEGATRADAGEFEPGSGYENYLDIAGNDYRIYFFDSNNTYLATFDPYVKPALNPEPDKINGVDTYYYNFVGHIPSNVGVSFKLVVLANWGEYPSEVKDDAYIGGFHLEAGKTTIEQLTTHANAQFQALTYPGEGDWLSEDRLIPFYGVRGYDLSNMDKYKDYIKDGKLVSDVFVNLQTSDQAIPLLRAMAKVEVILNNPLASFSKVEMTKVNGKGFCAPYQKSDNWKFDYTDYFHNYTWDTDFVRGVHLTHGATENKGGGTNDPNPQYLPFKKVSNYGDKDDAGNSLPEKWVAYVPEYQNIGVDSFTTINVELKKPENISDEEWEKIESDKKKNIIYFATNGSKENNDKSNVQATKTEAGRFNIERNNIYRFTITEMTLNIELKLDVIPYSSIILEPEFGLDRDENGNIIYPKSKQ